MHNARGSFNAKTRVSYFLRKKLSDSIPDPSSAYVHKEDLSNEVHTFFKQVWKVKPEEKHLQDLVSILFFG
jgi:hypothetical protein